MGKLKEIGLLVLSFLIPGLSHIIKGKWKDGVIFLETWAFLRYISLGATGDLFGIGATILRFVAVWHLYKLDKNKESKDKESEKEE